jgi:general secretion pathway protein A
MLSNRHTAKHPAVAPPAVRPSSDVYLRHFHLAADPFSLTPDPEFLYLSPAHAEALAALTLGVTGRNGVVVMTGEVGTGKTTLVYSLLRTLGDGMRTAYVSHTRLGFDDLLRLALADFGVQSPSPSRFDLLATLNAMLRDCSEHGRTAVLIVDEAHNLTDDDFEQLRLLSNFETFTHKLLQIVLVGQPELESRLRSRPLRALTERVAVHCRLAPLGRLESRAYLDYRLLQAGGSSRLFEPAARDLLLHRAQGVPRRINILCHNALLFAYGRGEGRVARDAAQAAIDARAVLMNPPEAASDLVATPPGRPRRRLALAGVAAAVAAAMVAVALRGTEPSEPSVTAPARNSLRLEGAAPLAPVQSGVAPASGAGGAAPSSAQPARLVEAAPDPEGPSREEASAPAAEDVAAAAALAREPVVPSAAEAQKPAITTAATGAEESAGPAGEPASAPVTGPPRDEPLSFPAAGEGAARAAADSTARALRVAPGQTLEELARSVYGGFDSEILRGIKRANPQVVDPDRILAGDVLRFPALPPSGTSEEEESIR